MGRSTSALVLGVLLLPAAIVHLSDRGPLVPAGGGTFDGAVQFVAGQSADPVGAWSYVALTYDGSTLRLFVNGTQVANRATAGTIEKTDNPLWFGGNHPFGEYFDGLIDEARVYDRALAEAEIRADMATPVAAGGTTGNGARVGAGARSPAVGPCRGVLVRRGVGDVGDRCLGPRQRWADHRSDMDPGPVRERLELRWRRRHRAIPASASLDVSSELTLSAWIRPTASQSGWRTIIYRERDIFFLDAGSNLEGLPGRVDDVLAGSVVAAAAWFSVVLLIGRGRWIGPRRHAWPVAAVMLLVGCVVDAAFAHLPLCSPRPCWLCGSQLRRRTARRRPSAGWSPSGSRRQPPRRSPIGLGSGSGCERRRGSCSLGRSRRHADRHRSRHAEARPAIPG